MSIMNDNIHEQCHTVNILVISKYVHISKFTEIYKKNCRLQNTALEQIVINVNINSNISRNLYSVHNNRKEKSK